MGLRCTVLGHAWNDPQIEREREESDAEVVTTVREFKECKRCGSREIVSENVEVTAQAATGRREETTGGPGTDAEAGADDAAVIEDAETGERTVVDEAEATDPSSDDAPADGTVDDGAVILDDSSTDPDREPGEWPEHDVDVEDDTGSTEPPSWPDHDDESAGDEGPPAETGGDADPTDAGRSTADGQDDAHAGGETDGDASDGSLGGEEPRSAVVADGEEDEVEVITSDPAPAGSGESTTPSGDPVDPAEALSEAAADQGDEDGPVEPTVEADVDIEVACPNCGFLDEGPSPSLRGGDSCPKCRSAYLEEREM